MSAIEEDWEEGWRLIVIVDIIKNFPVISEKSMLSEARQKKTSAFTAIREKDEKGFGTPITKAQLYKKKCPTWKPGIKRR